MKTRKHRSDLMILFSVLALIAIGLVVIYAIGPMRANVLNSAYGANYDSNYFFWHQLISVVVGIAAFFVAFFVSYKKVFKVSKWIMLLGLFASLMLFVMSYVGKSMVKCELGACRWFAVGSISFQPAELLKLGLVLYLPSLIKKKKEEGTIGSLKEFWLPIAVVVGLSLFFVVVLQKDLGTGAVLLAISVAIIFASGVPLRQFLAMLAIVGVAGVLAIAFSSHRMERLTTFLGGGDADSNYHIDNAKIAIGTGGLFGVGIGNSVQATGYLPESINDSVFAIMGETFGFVGLMFVMLIFIAIPLRLLKVSEGTADTEGRLAAIGVFAWFLTHVIVNVAAMTGLIPLTGITLPLLSYGGTSIAFMALALGLTLQLSCYTSREVNNEDTSSGRGLRGSHYSSRRRRS